MESFLRLCTSSMLPSLCAEDLNKANTKTRFSKLQWERGKKHGDARQWRSRKIAFRVFVSFSLLRCFSGLDDETGKKFISIKMVNKDLWVIEWSGACFLRTCKIQASPLACNYTVLSHWEAKLFVYEQWTPFCVCATRWPWCHNKCVPAGPNFNLNGQNTQTPVLQCVPKQSVTFEH